MREMKDSGVAWIGEIPEEWYVCQFRHVHSGTNVGESIDKNYWTNSDADMTFYTAGLLPITTSFREFPEDKVTRQNDILLARNGTPYVYIPLPDAAYTDHIIRVSINDSLDRRYIGYCLAQSISFEVVDTVSIATWSASLWNKQYVTLPPLPEQRRIADFLDRKCAELDAVIEKTRATIKEYKKLKQAVITEAVSRGVHGDRTMKDSGIEWIGDIPEEWAVSKVKYFTNKIGSGKTPPGGAENYANTGVLFLRSQNIYDDGLHLENPTYITEEVDEEMANTRVKAHDVLLNITGGSIGRACIMPEEELPANVNQHVSIIRVKQEKVLPELMHYFWISDLGKKAIALYQTGGNREGMSADAIANTPYLLYSIAEQQEIADHLDVKCSEIDKLIAKKEQYITELQSFKKSLIYEYVTGKKEVPA